MTVVTTPQFTLTFVNGLCGDPAVFGYMPRTGKGWLFDLGAIDNLSNKDVLRVTHACISHTHIDHFIGFDRLVRVNIPHFRHITLFGPKGLARNVQAKLQGYTWNLLQPDQLRFTVHEVHQTGETHVFTLTNSDQFALHLQGRAAMPIDIGHGMTLVAVPLSHGDIPSIAYKIRMSPRVKVDGERLVADGLERGPWIQALQSTASHAYRDSPKDWRRELLTQLPNTTTVGASSIPTAELLDRYFSFARPDSIGYVTDIGFTDDNLAACRATLKPLTHLVCEASFLMADAHRAAEKSHLTTHQAVELATACECPNLYTFHYSNIYGGDTSLHQKEIGGDPKGGSSPP